VGNVIARIRSDRVLAQVPEGVGTGAGEIPFAIDPSGELHTSGPEDLAVLHDLGLATRGKVPEDGGEAPRPTVANPEQLAAAVNKPDWIAVIQQNAETGYTFGVVRQVASEVQDILEATLINLFVGFVLIGMAGVGVFVFSRRMTMGLEALTDGARRIAEGDLGHRIEARRRDELGQLAGAFNDMAADLAVTRKRLLEQERVRRELEIAREIQRESLPRRPYTGDEVEIFGRSIPSNEVGGDFYNFLPLDRGRLAVLIGDVSGKGIPAALMMAEVQATLRTLLQYEHSLGRVMRQLNSELVRSKPDNVYLTLFLGILDRDAGTLTYVNAGHTPPFLLRAAGGLVEELPSSTRPVGLYEEFDATPEQIAVGRGDLICLCTDGVVESVGTDGTEEFFGRQRVEAAIRQLAGSPLPSVMDEVARRLTGFHGSDALEDDATLVLVRIGWGEGKRIHPPQAESVATGTGLVN
jgi:sigma-B regulation protein RsbU (phosphoserine phosphatase)